MGDLMHQVIVVVWPGLGIDSSGGGGPSRVPAELPGVATYIGGLEVPTLQWLGLGNIASIRGIEPAAPPAASHGRIVAPELGVLIGEAARAVIARRGQVHLIGGAVSELDVAGAVSHPQGARSALEQAGELVETSQTALIVAVPRPEECPSSASPVTAARAVQRLDLELARLFDQLQGREDVMVFVTSSGGRATHPRPGPSAEWVPILVYLGLVPSGVALGLREPGDLGATAAEALGASALGGSSFLAELLA